MYFDQGGGISNLGGNPAGTVELRAPWNDANGDTFVQMNELDLTELTLQSGNFDLSTGLPESVVSEEIVDANAWNGRTREAIATVSHELMDELRAGCELHLPEGRSQSLGAPDRRDP